MPDVVPIPISPADPTVESQQETPPAPPPAEVVTPPRPPLAFAADIEIQSGPAASAALSALPLAQMAQAAGAPRGTRIQFDNVGGALRLTLTGAAEHEGALRNAVGVLAAQIKGVLLSATPSLAVPAQPPANQPTPGMPAAWGQPRAAGTGMPPMPTGQPSGMGMPQGAPQGVPPGYAPAPPVDMETFVRSLGPRQWDALGDMFFERVVGALRNTGAPHLVLQVNIRIEDGRVGVVLSQTDAEGNPNPKATTVAETDDGAVSVAVRQVVTEILRAAPATKPPAFRFGG